MKLVILVILVISQGCALTYNSRQMAKCDDVDYAYEMGGKDRCKARMQARLDSEWADFNQRNPDFYNVNIFPEKKTSFVCRDTFRGRVCEEE